MVEYAKTFEGVPYLWGGSNPISGMDCSGFVQYVLDAFGLDLPGDQNAQSYFNYFSKHGKECELIEEGALVFYGASKDKISHIALAINEHQIIEAGGGDSTTTSLEKASKQNACVRVKMWNRRRDIQGVFLPAYPDWIVT